MKVYRTNEIDCHLPKDWQDNTINMFSLPAASNGNAASLVITRDLAPQSLDISKYSDFQLVEAAKRLPNYRLIARNPIQVAGQQTLELSYLWSAPDKTEVRQHQCCIFIEQMALIFTVSVRIGEFEQYEPSWRAFLESVSLRLD